MTAFDDLPDRVGLECGEQAQHGAAIFAEFIGNVFAFEHIAHGKLSSGAQLRRAAEVPWAC